MGASTKSTSEQYMRYGLIGRFSGRILWMFVVALGLLLVSGSRVFASGYVDSQGSVNIDVRWVPWIGSWRLVSNTVNTTDKDLKGDYRLEVSPGDRGTAVTMKAFQDETVLFEDTIITDGVSQPLKEKECSGWYKYFWADTGKRLLFESESSCPDKPQQKISGISVIDRNGNWVDIQLFQSLQDRIITVRRYSLISDKTEDFEGQGIQVAGLARLHAGTHFSIDEVIELSAKMPSEVLEAALMELHEPFKINSKTLVRLSDSGVPASVIDLMVALSFPEKFYIERGTVSIQARTDDTSIGPRSAYSYPPYGYYSVVDPYFPWYWTPSTYSLYWNSGWGTWPGMYYPFYSGGGSPGRDVRYNGGRLVEGQGYTRVSPRTASSGSAHPRSADGRSTLVRGSSGSGSGSSSSGTYSRSSGGVVTSGGGGGASAPSSGSSSGAAPSSSGGSSSGSSGGSSSGGSSGGYSGGGSPSASPGGYSSGGSGGGSAQPR
jgi:hypothetical protein